jgi:hypothetical protein
MEYLLAAVTAAAPHCTSIEAVRLPYAVLKIDEVRATAMLLPNMSNAHLNEQN